MITKPILQLLLLLVMCFPAISMASNYQRIVSLDICSDWMLASYAQRSQVVALSPLLNDYQVDWVQGEWPTHDGSLERVLELNPDLVITGEFNATILRRRLQELGVQVRVFALPKSLMEVHQYMQQFLRLLGNESELPQLPRFIEPEDNAPRLLLLGANGVGTGTGTLEHEVLEQAGWRNYIKGSGYGKLNMEQLIIEPPDAVLWSAPVSPALANMFIEHPALQKVMRDRYSKNLTFGHWQCSGPWTWQQLEKLTTLRKQWQNK